MTFRFGIFEVDEHSHQLRKNGVRVRLQGKPFQLLAILLERAGEVVTRDEFHKAIWNGDPFGELDHNLNNAINKLRNALCDRAATPRYIETVPRVGYRFIAPVSRSANGERQPRESEPAATIPAPKPFWQLQFHGKSLTLATAFLVLCVIAAAGFNVRHLGSHISSAAAAESLPEGRKTDVAAREDYVKGRYFWNKRNKPDLLLAIRYFEDAATRNPDYALAYSGLADSYSVLGMVTPNPRSLYREARRAALESVRLDDKSAEAHTSLALVYLCDFQFPDATREFLSAIALNPNYPTAHHWFGLHLRNLGCTREGLNELEMAHRLDPLSLPISFALANAYRKDGHYAEAERNYAEIMKLDSGFQRVRAGLALLYAMQHRPLSVFAGDPHATTLEEDPEIAEYVAAGLYLNGRKKQASELMFRLTRQVSSFDGQCFPVLLAAMGEKEQLISCLERGYDQRAGYMPQIKSDPVFREVRLDPRFQALLRRVGFPSDAAAR